MASPAARDEPRAALFAFEEQLGRVILGKPGVIRDVLTALLAGGRSP
ncbi:MAG TPA: hypothetical protein VFM29_00805 [Vicinamibacteria bacterium]|nr:hypothetical protein [Vicinamibacteria bacterium]